MSKFDDFAKLHVPGDPCPVQCLGCGQRCGGREIGREGHRVRKRLGVDGQRFRRR